eukprot:CAMPEP_0177333274 /NCGR_PEP_ID=MMETSP0368-20130122/22076_1 /TAXON_ID=447022 ORGANISM="Scrippsiella hangoei-like, Strain SHHI-4" /NCGR_SAMPLE_ID=MMETSP0368 /ASSEMBLY_ACC=CAM_ASM_000363 /LENGTH=90 /DNA_ID=CAMNT_0018793871 /DNA_START=371 /DNA_END=643 /DNA_ORIENTATION=+
MDCVHCASWSCCNWQRTGAAACVGAPSWRWTTSVCRGPMIESTARLATLMPTPVAMPDAIEPMRPDIMPPPPPAATGAGVGAAMAGGGAW